MALSCYGRAMDHVGVMASDPAFRWLDRVILDLHFDACYFQRDKEPGLYRTRGIEVTSPTGGPPAFVGPPHEDVPGLVDEVVDWLHDGDTDAHAVVRAAMAHLHLVSVHPFRDGNGRIARIVQSLVLAREGLLAPSSVPSRSTSVAIPTRTTRRCRRCRAAATSPSATRAPGFASAFAPTSTKPRSGSTRSPRPAQRWAILEELVERRGWPDRLVIALEQSLFRGTDRASYAEEADVSPATASADLRRLQDAGF